MSFFCKPTFLPLGHATPRIHILPSPKRAEIQVFASRSAFSTEPAESMMVGRFLAAFLLLYARILLWGANYRLEFVKILERLFVPFLYILDDSDNLLRILRVMAVDTENVIVDGHCFFQWPPKHASYSLVDACI